jgi:hypothetical protein
VRNFNEHAWGISMSAIIGGVQTLIEVDMNHPGMSGDSTSWEGWSHVRWFVEEVSAGAA